MGPLLAFSAAFLGTALMIPAARRGGLIDRAAPGEEFRKPHREPVALVGGLALALAALVTSWPAMGFEPQLTVAQSRTELSPTAAAAGVALLALFLGQLDDRLHHRRHRIGRLLLALPTRLGASGILGLGAGLANGHAVLSDPGQALFWVGAGLLVGASVATYDHADGLAGGLGLAALWFPSPTLAAACLGFLPWNFSWRPRLFKPGTEAAAAQSEASGLPPGSGRPPPAYLGNAGSSLLGAWILLTPAAWPALVVPLADVTRVSFLRLAAGRRPWSGDRCHLGHRLLACGFMPLSVAVMCTAACLPAVLAAALRPASQPFLWGGIVGSLAAYGFLLLVTPRLLPDGRAA